MLKRTLLIGLVAVLALGIAAVAAFQLSPWPSVLLIRYPFQHGAAKAAASQAAFAPKGLTEFRDLSYAPGDHDARLDIFAPRAETPLAAVVWVHGGGFVAGARSELENYVKILAGRGFAVASIDYTLAPNGTFPTPIRQTNEALAYLRANAARFGIDPHRIFLGGDSAGAQIAAQTALVVSDPDYAREMSLAPGIPRSDLQGLVLFCGPYDPSTMNFEGGYGRFMRIFMWAYLGTRDPKDPRLRLVAVTPHVTPRYPPAFISVGNADALAPQSVALAEALQASGAKVETLFFPRDYRPALPHEYQLDFSTPEAHRALEAVVGFLKARGGSNVGANSRSA